MMTHGKSEFVSWGATSLNPYVSDLYVEYIKNGQYMAGNRDTWEKIEETSEVIKVRFGEDIDFKIRFTRNGVLLPSSWIDGSASALQPWISNEILKQPTEAGEIQAQYSMAHMYDPFTHRRFGIEESDFRVVEMYKLLAGVDKNLITGE